MTRNHPKSPVVHALMRSTWQSGLGAMMLACATTTPTAPRGCQLQSVPEHAQVSAEPRAPRVNEGDGALLDDPDGRALEPFFAALRELEASRAATPLRVLQLGDSHTQDGTLVRRVRARLQSRFGDGGVGLVLPGVVAHYGMDDEPARREAPEESWSITQGLRRGETALVGVGAVRVTATRAGATVSFGPWRGRTLNAAHVEVLHEARDGGFLEYRLDQDEWRRLPDDGSLRSLTPVTRFALRSGGAGAVDLYGVSVETGAPGIVVEGAGVVGAHASQLASLDWSLLGPQITRRAPKLVVLQFGTNEVASRHGHPSAIEATFVGLIERVRQFAPGSAVLVFGPPDMARREGLGWATPTRLGEVIAAERRAAARTGAAFFDACAALGGEGRMDAMVNAAPPLAYPDHVHLRRAGYERLADAYVDALLARYARWRAAHPE